MTTQLHFPSFVRVIEFVLIDIAATWLKSFIKVVQKEDAVHAVHEASGSAVDTRCTH